MVNAPVITMTFKPTKLIPPALTFLIIAATSLHLAPTYTITDFLRAATIATLFTLATLHIQLLKPHLGTPTTVASLALLVALISLIWAVTTTQCPGYPAPQKCEPVDTATWAVGGAVMAVTYTTVVLLLTKLFKVIIRGLVAIYRKIVSLKNPKK